MMENNTLIPDHFNTPGLPALLSEKKLRFEELKVKVERLNTLASELDPYQPLSEEMTKELAALGIVRLDDPYAITNQLVVITEDAIDELRALEAEFSA